MLSRAEELGTAGFGFGFYMKVVLHTTASAQLWGVENIVGGFFLSFLPQEELTLCLDSPADPDQKFAMKTDEADEEEGEEVEVAEEMDIEEKENDAEIVEKLSNIITEAVKEGAKE